MESYRNHTTEKKKTSKESGFTLLEVIVAIAILGFGLLGVASMQIASIEGNDFAGSFSTGIAWATDRMEKLMVLSYSATDLTSGDHTDPSPPSGYTITWNVTDDFPISDTKRVIVTVTWTDRQETKSTAVQGVIPRII